MADCGRGLTPNPDLACNRHIKFDALLAFARDKLGADAVATGHYARLLWPSEAAAAAAATAALRGEAAPIAHASGPGGLYAAAEGEHDELGPQLLRGVDRCKDQSYFLASVERSSLARVLFPLGGMQKPAVRALAAEAGLAPADRRSSAGICFIGRRDFGDFLSQYAPPAPGCYVDVDGGADLGPCPNLLALTHGQRPGLGGLPGKTYVAGKDVVAGVAYVARGRDHAALLCRTALLRTPHWLSGRHAAALAAHGWLACEYKARYGQQPAPCVLVHAGAPPLAEAVATAAALANGAGVPLDAAAMASLAAGFQPSAYCRLRPEDAGVGAGYLAALFPAPSAAITPGQAFVLYDGELCLGSAPIAQPGMSLHEERAAASDAAAAAVPAAAA